MMAIGTVVVDFIAIYVLPNKHFYTEKKFRFVVSEEEKKRIEKKRLAKEQKAKAKKEKERKRKRIRKRKKMYLLRLPVLKQDEAATSTNAEENNTSGATQRKNRTKKAD